MQPENSRPRRNQRQTPRNSKSGRWKGNETPSSPTPTWKVSRRDRTSVILNFLEVLDTPKALAISILLKAAEFDGDTVAARTLAEGLPISPNDYQNPNRFARDWQAVKLLSKATWLRTGIDLEAVAIETARQSEDECFLTNQAIRAYRSGTLRFRALTEDRLSIIQGLIAKTLAMAPTPQDVGWSSGRTSSAFGESLDPISKYSSRLDVTASARRWALGLLRDSPMWGAAALQADAPVSVLPSALTVTEGNTMLVVPKNAKTGRVICYEPHMNIRLQLAVGNSIRAALRKQGVNLNDQSVNQRRALLSSRVGHLATIDLRSASDRVALELVHLLLPLPWATVLDDLRSKYTTWPDGSVLRNEKFSSMGNGFTFELESLIFWAAATAVCGSGVSVYGDDIIIPAQHYDEVVAVLSEMGFAVNDQKSFSCGPFRESCGCDGFLGVDVTPIKVTDDLTTRSRWVLFHNQVRRWARAHCPTKEVAEFLADMRRGYPYTLGPMLWQHGTAEKEYGQGHYHVNWDEACPNFCAYKARGWEGWSYFQWTQVRTRVQVDFLPNEGFAALASATGPKRLKTVYDSVSKRQKWIKTRSWASEWPSIQWV